MVLAGTDKVWVVSKLGLTLAAQSNNKQTTKRPHFEHRLVLYVIIYSLTSHYQKASDQF